MNDFLDYRTLAFVFVLKSVLQTLGLFYVWYIDRQYPPARKWAIGSLCFAAAALLTLVQPSSPPATLIIGRNACAYAGLFIFGAGLCQARLAYFPNRLFGILAIASLLANWWFTIHTPSLSARIVIFSMTFGSGEAYVAVCALRAPAGPLRGTFRIIGFLLVLEAAVALFRGVSALQVDYTFVFQKSTAQTVFILVSIGASFLLALALTILTGQRTTALLAAVLDNLDHGVAMFGDDKRLVVCNRRYAEIYDAMPGELRPGTALPTIIARRIAKGIFAGASPHRYFNERTIAALEPLTELHRLSDGRSIVVSRRPLQFGGWLTTHADVTAVQQIEAQVAYLAHHDSLTGLANRQLFSDRLEEALARLNATGEGFAILLIDLDRFKAINDTLGHPSGDALLAGAAQRLRNCATDSDVVARLGGDEFAILQMASAGPDTTSRLARHVLDSLGASFDLDGQKVVIGSSVGIARAPENGADADQLMRNADLALYRSKADGRNCYRFYDRDMDADLRARHSLELALRNSIMCDDFLLEYQPVFDVERNRICAAEALVRWRHPAGSVIEPAKFIGIAEETGLIVPLGEWILRKACSDAVSWPKNRRVSVNLSPVQFIGGNICEIVESVLQETGLPPAQLELEVTESIFLHSDEASLSMLHRLKELGVSIALDDFGTGYSSLNYLTKFPFDRIKIDKSFVVDFGRRKESSAIVTAIIHVARSLAMATTVEGVETVEQYELLRIAGCTEMQGYLFGRPQPMSELTFADWECVAAKQVA